MNKRISSRANLAVALLVLSTLGGRAAFVVRAAPGAQNAFSGFEPPVYAATLQNFHAGAQNGDLMQMRRMVAQKPALVQARDARSGSTALHLASTPEVAAFLLDHGADVNAQDKDKRTPLLDAVLYRGDEAQLLVEMLARRGADLNLADALGNSPLHIAVAVRARKLALFLQSQGARDTTTPLFDALARGDAERFQGLLREHPALVRDTPDVQAAMRSQLVLTAALSPLHAAVLWNRAPFVQMLLDAKADASARDAQGETPLHEAAALDEADICARLLDAGADPNARTRDTRSFTNGRPYETGFTPLHIAAAAGALPVAELLLKRGGAVDTLTLISGGYLPRGQQPRVGNTPLLLAVNARNAPLVDLLLSHGANANGPQNDGAPLLHALDDEHRNGQRGVAPLTPASTARRQIVQRLLAAKADPNARDTANRTDQPDTALGRAAVSGDVALVTLLLEAGAGVNTPTTGGETPLHLAIRFRSGRRTNSLAAFQKQPDVGTPTLAQVLLAHGADAGARDKAGRTPLFDAARYGDLDAVRDLSKRGADVNATDKAGRTPLFDAIEHPDLPLMRELLARGARVDAVDGAGHTPLQLIRARYNVTAYDPIAALLRAQGGRDAAGALFDAIAQGDKRAVSTSIGKAPALLLSRDSLGEPPLTWAIRNEQNGIVALLIARGANIEERANGSTPIFMAAGSGPIATAALLLRHGAKVNAHGGDEGETPLFWAINNADAPAMIALLLRAGADVKEAAVKTKRTPLHACMEEGVRADPAVWSLLLRAGADVNARDRWGQTPLHLAAVNDKGAALSWLLAHGANASARDNNGWTPLRWAQKRGHSQTAALLKPNSTP